MKISKYDLIKIAKKIVTENKQQKLNENFIDINMDKLLNLFITDPVRFMEIFNIDNNKVLTQAQSIKLSLASAKGKRDLIKNMYDTHKNLKATIDGIDVSSYLKELVYPTDIEKLINDTDNFLKIIEKRVKERKNRASLRKDFINPYGRTSITNLTPLKVVNDFKYNPKTNFNIYQREYAQADLDLQLIKLMKDGDLELKTSYIMTDDDFKKDIAKIWLNGLKGEDLIDAVHIRSLRDFVNRFWKKNKKEIEHKYNDEKNKGVDSLLVKTIDNLKK